MDTNELIKRFVPDYSNTLIQDINQPFDLWKNSVLDQNYWEPLLQYSFVETDVKAFFETLPEDRKLSYFGFAVECMMNFVQANFTGPELPHDFNTFFDMPLFKNHNFSDLLAFANEEINNNTKYPALLVAAKCVFENCKVSPLLNFWWMLRGIMVHQHLIEESIPELLKQANIIEEELENIEHIDCSITAQLEIEQAQLYNLFRNIPKVRGHISVANDILGIDYKLTGKEGKRTKHQTQDLPQLAVELELSRDENTVFVQKLEVPESSNLDDDVRLDEISFKDGITFPALTDAEQKLLIAFIHEQLISRPNDELHSEEIQPYINLLLHQNNTWPVKVAVLLARFYLERKKSRTIQRSLIQCDEIVKSFSKQTPHPLNRVCAVYGVNFQPIWKTEAQLAQLWVATECTKTGLDIYLKLQLWDEVIACYVLLGMRHKAEEVIMQQLEKSPTVKLWCLLGDMKDDITYYEKAWDFSNHRSARSKRHWGEYYYARKQYKESIPHLRHSLNLNPIQPHVWFKYGYATMEVEDWQSAVTAYNRYTTLDPDNFQAWNNLAKAHIKMGNKRAAHQALHDAIRCEYNQWQVWDNLMVISIDLAHFSDVIYAYHQILDLKKKHLDLEVLSALVYGVSNNVTDFNGNPGERLMGKTRELLGRIVSIYPLQGHVWELYASLAPSAFLKMQRLQRSLKGFTQPGWDNDFESCLQVLYVCEKLGQISVVDQIDATDSLLNSVRLQLKSCVSTVKKKDYQETKKLVVEVDKLLDKVKEKIDSGNKVEGKE